MNLSLKKTAFLDNLDCEGGRFTMCESLITEGSGRIVEIDLIFTSPLLIISALPTHTNTTALRTLHIFKGW